MKERVLPVASIDEIRDRIGSDIGVSHWIRIDQAMIDRFADLSGDRQFIHVDPAAAAATPFGGTVAHGFLTLSLLSQMGAGVMLVPEDMRMAVNYGFDKIRFIAPVASGKRVRGRFTLAAVHEKQQNQWQLVHKVLVEIESEAKPALQAEWISLIFT